MVNNYHEPAAELEKHSRPSCRLRCFQMIARRQTRHLKSPRKINTTVLPGPGLRLAKLWSLLQKQIKAAEKRPQRTKQITYTVTVEQNPTVFSTPTTFVTPSPSKVSDLSHS